MVSQSADSLTGNAAFEGYSIDLIAEISKILSKWLSYVMVIIIIIIITIISFDIIVFNIALSLSSCYPFRVQLQLQVGWRRCLRVQEQGDRGMEWANGGAASTGKGHSGKVNFSV